MSRTPRPDRVNRESRIQPPHDHLKAMGLYVNPIYLDGEIDSLHVAVDLPNCGPKEAAEAGIVMPVQGSEVGETVATAEDRGLVVVNFPSVR